MSDKLIEEASELVRQYDATLKGLRPSSLRTKVLNRRRILKALIRRATK